MSDTDLAQRNQGYTPPNASSSEYQPIPLDKVEDFGVHANSYYQLDVSIFKSSLDTQLLSSLWNKYWVNTLGQSPLISVSFSSSASPETVRYSRPLYPFSLDHTPFLNSTISLRNSAKFKHPQRLEVPIVPRFRKMQERTASRGRGWKRIAR
jgi:hypothetical protein